jgi:nucleoside-diphosphate-sugar epimerase
MRVLVTGAAGRTGREVVAALARAGHEVLGTDQVAATGSAGDAPAECARFVHGDLRDKDLVIKLVCDVDALVHCAAIISPYGLPDDYVYINNVHSTFLVLNEAGRSGARRAVALSSLSALGLAYAAQERSPRYVPVDEDHPLEVEDPYGLSKTAGEAIASMAHRRWGTDIVSIRLANVVTGDVLRDRAARLSTDPFSNRKELWGWLDTRDAAAAVLCALQAPVRGHTVVQVTAPTAVVDRPTEELLSTYFPEVERRTAFPGRQALFATRRCEQVLGFRASYPTVESALG